MKTMTKLGAKAEAHKNVFFFLNSFSAKPFSIIQIQMSVFFSSSFESKQNQ